MRTVYLGLSGGVDSSVAGYLLKAQGYRVIGIYMKNWARSLPGFQCPWKEDLSDAKAVAAQLGIDFEVFDFQDEYRQKVVDYLIDGYKAGLTPNPDVVCNQHIKFSLFLDAALDQGADLIATGHYARTTDGRLYTALDSAKDQSYFLYRVTSAALDRTLFPLGELTKKAVRAIAADKGFVTARKKDSTGICFVGEVGLKQFLRSFAEPEPGPIVDATGQEIGRHDGALFYTIGQRHGLNVGGGQPYYVTDKDMDKNIVYVTTDPQDDQLWSRHLRLISLSWIKDIPPAGYQGSAQIRYRGAYVGMTIDEIDAQHCLVSLVEPVQAAAAGQSVVIYGPPPVGGLANYRLVWGGGVIASKS